MVLLSLLACALESPSVAGPGPDHPSLAPAGFWDHWGDGQAELAGYRLTQPRYAELRQGEAVHVVVTEDFTRATQVKSDGGHGDEFPVLKLNAVRDFQTGLYDYNVLTSVFLPLDGRLPIGQPTKLSLSVQEWCGHVYEHLVLAGGWADWVRHSYFDGEADGQARTPVPPDGIYADTLPLIVRGLTGERVPLGGSIDVPWMPTGLDRRAAHVTPVWGRATLRRAAGGLVESVLGTVESEVWTVTPAEGPESTWVVESAAPRRLLSWSRTDGEAGVLTGVVRGPYWRQHDNGDEALRASLGLGANGWSRAEGE